MIIRDFQKKHSYKRPLRIFLTAIIAILILIKGGYMLYSNLKDTGNNLSTNKPVTTRTTIAGTIKSDADFPLYTHSLTTSNGAKFFLKSTTINLNDYLGENEIAGTIREYTKNLPIIEVDTIKFPEQGLIKKGNSYLFTKDLIFLDFEGQPALTANKTGNDIIVYFNNKKIFSIERFLCSKILKDKWCNGLIQDYDKNQRENFDSYRGYTFYKHGTGFWTTFDGNSFWYIFKNIQDDILLNISSMIKLIDKWYIIGLKRKEIEASCKKKNPEFETISFSEIAYEENNTISLYTEDHTDKEKSISCKTTFNIWEDRKILE